MAILSRLPFPRRRAPVVSVLRLGGVIGRVGAFRRGLALEPLAPALERAFSGRRTAAVALSIDSPGGSPVQADLIQRRVADLAREKRIPVFAFCEDVAASGGYWIALAATEIHANPNSIVGSIGVVSAGFGFDRAIARLGVERRLYATGPAKGMLDPFRAEDPEHVERLRALHGEIFDRFRDLVRERRGDRLAGPEEEIFSGAFWTGSKALEYGLVDGLGELRATMRERFGENTRFRVVGGRRGLLRRFRPAGAAPGAFEPDVGSWAEDALAAVEARALWSRFGL